MSQIIPFTPSIETYSFSTPITTPGGDVTYGFDVHYNRRDKSWYFDLREADQTLIAPGIKVVLGTYLGRRIQHPLFWDGAFFAIDTSGSRRDATLDDFGTRVQVYYFTEQDIVMAYLRSNFIDPVRAQP